MSSSFNSVLTAIVAGSITLCSIVTEDNANAAEPIQFNKDIRPILSDRCFPCHGPDENQRESGLRLDEREAAMQAADSGQAAIVPHDADASELVRRVFSADEEAMPPAEFNKPLSNEEKQLLRRWIDEGADYQRHWAFAPPKHAAVPQVLDSSWPRNAVDYFILERMESAGLAPSPPADWLTLLRRLSLDITGLPPAPTEVEQFQRELANVSSRAEEDLLVARWVDRLLASPHFGERMAVDWLDAARFADTNGYQVDRDREMYAWRDWVINAFNANQPFDQFTIEQLAGDLLPEPTLSQRIATGFHRNHMLNEEGGIIPEEFLAEYCSDRVETTATVWLGQTFNCCRCHDHKFDAFTQKDYYGLYAFFHNIAEKGVGNYGASIRRNAPPMLKLPAPELEAKLQQLHEKLSQTKLQLVQLDAGFEAEQQEWESRLLASTVLWTPLRLASAKIADDDLAVEEDQLAAIVSELLPGKQELEVSATVTRPGVTSVSIKLAPVSTADWTDRSLAVTKLSLSASAEHAPVEQPLAIKGIEVGPSLKREEVAKALDNDETSKTQVTLQAGGEAVLAVVIDQSPLPPPFTLRLKLSLESNESAEPWKLALATTETESDLLIPAE
ncbi:MAG: DUF1549 domain-containing protein, partial [Planctomycetales bacterium]|nr:DUF1549 domain-containing protein [Planctomycetales bacterium]